MHQMSLKNVIEDQNFWYSDGNVILAVTNTPSRNTDDMNLNVTLLSISGNESSAVQETLIDGKSQEVVLFRVHKSILSKHSQVFADMFSLPDVPSLSESGDENLTAMRLTAMFQLFTSQTRLSRSEMYSPSFTILCE